MAIGLITKLAKYVTQLINYAKGAIDVADKGASPDSLDNYQAIQDCIDLAASRGGGDVWFKVPGVYTTSKLTLKNGVVLRAKFGAVELKLKDGANSPLLESLGFDSLYVTASTPGTDVYTLPYDFGFDGLILNGNRANQTVRGIPLVKFYGARLHLNGQIYGSKGPTLRTACFGAHSQSRKTPGKMQELELFDGDEEMWIFEGPSDQYFGHLVTSVCGDQSNNGTVPQTSTVFPGEPVHALRIQSGSFHLASANINGTRFGRGIYANGRLKLGDVIAAGNWGNFFATAAAFGSISSLHVQANPSAWNGIVYPSIENLSDDIQFGNVTALRVTGQDQPTAPLIKDSGGAQWGNVRNRQALTEGGTFFMADAPAVSINSLDAKGAAIGLHTTVNANRININATFNNCTQFWKNEAAKIRGSWDLTGDLSAGQVFATGLVDGALADDSSLAAARIDFLLAGVWKTNSFRGSANFDSLVTTAQTITINHNLWRTPKNTDITTDVRISSWATEPTGIDHALSSFDATSIRVRVKLAVAATGTPTAQVLCKVN